MVQTQNVTLYFNGPGANSWFYQHSLSVPMWHRYQSWDGLFAGYPHGTCINSKMNTIIHQLSATILNGNDMQMIYRKTFQIGNVKVYWY